MGSAFSPLDEALGLLPGSPYSPQTLGWLVRLGAELPFARAAFWLGELTGLPVSAATVRRQTAAVGATSAAWEEQQATQTLQAWPPAAPVAHPARLVIGADGAMVPLVGGEWGEAKLVSVGEPAAPTSDGPDGPTARVEARVETRVERLSYFARLSDAETFTTHAWGELRRRGVDGAGAVAAVQDGAPWLQGFVDLHRPDAVRILDWPHAAEHLTALAAAVFGAETVRAQRAARRLRAWLWQDGPERLLAVCAGWLRVSPAHPTLDRPALTREVAYFHDRRAQLTYPAFRAAGWPVGSGATESGHKRVMQARMKRAGMRWARPHVNPLLALTLLELNGRWTDTGPGSGVAMLALHQATCHQQRRQRQQARWQARCAHTPSPPAPAPLPVRHPWRRYGVPLSAKI